MEISQNDNLDTIIVLDTDEYNQLNNIFKVIIDNNLLNELSIDENELIYRISDINMDDFINFIWHQLSICYNTNSSQG